MGSPGQAAGAALAASATGLFVTFLEAETHEGSLVLALEQLVAWAARYTNHNHNHNLITTMITINISLSVSS